MVKHLSCVFAAVVFLLAAGHSTAGYHSELARATKSGKVYSAMTWDAKVLWHATFFDERFRQAFEEYYVERNHMGPVEAARFIKEQELQQASSWEFYIVMFTKKAYKPFSTEFDSFWKVFLTTGLGEKVLPNEIDLIPVTPVEEVMLPHITRWSKLYRARFPKVDLGGKFSLTLQSIVGETTLKWKRGAKSKTAR